MQLRRFGGSLGMGVFTAIGGTPVAVVGLAVGLALGLEGVQLSSTTLLARSLVWHLYHGPCAEECPSGERWNHWWNQCEVPPV